MTAECPNAAEKTRYETLMDIRYACRLSGMNVKAYRTLDWTFGFIGLFGGASALVSAVGQFKGAGVVAGLAVAAVAIIERLVRPIEKAIEHERLNERFTEILVRAATEPLDAVDKDFTPLQHKSVGGFSLLEVPAFNANALSHDRPDLVIPVTRWQRFAVFLFA